MQMNESNGKTKEHIAVYSNRRDCSFRLLKPRMNSRCGQAPGPKRNDEVAELGLRGHMSHESLTIFDLTIFDPNSVISL